MGKKKSKTKLQPKPEAKSPRWLPWTLAVGCLILLGIAALIVVPRHPAITEPTPPPTGIGQRYVYRITEGVFSSYVGGKVIEEDKLGRRLGRYAVEAGWEKDGEKLSSEKLKAEVYAINNVPGEVAVALKFLDKGEAITTDHYYVILNPQADLTAVSDYVIPDWTPNNPGDE